MLTANLRWIAMGFMVVAIVTHGFADALPHFTVWLVDTSNVATSLAALFLSPPTPPPAAATHEGTS